MNYLKLITSKYLISKDFINFVEAFNFYEYYHTTFNYIIINNLNEQLIQEIINNLKQFPNLNEIILNYVINVNCISFIELKEIEKIYNVFKQYFKNIKFNIIDEHLNKYEDIYIDSFDLKFTYNVFLNNVLNDINILLWFYNLNLIIFNENNEIMKISVNDLSLKYNIVYYVNSMDELNEIKNKLKDYKNIYFTNKNTDNIKINDKYNIDIDDNEIYKIFAKDRFMRSNSYYIKNFPYYYEIMKLKINDIKTFNKLKNIIVNYVHIDYGIFNVLIPYKLYKYGVKFEENYYLMERYMINPFEKE